MPRKKKIEEETLSLDELLIEENLTEDFEEDEEEEEPKPRKRTRKDVPVFVFADVLHMKALYYIDLFGATDPPVFTNVIETELEVQEDEDEES